MYNYNEVEKRERRRIISVAVAAAVLILVLIVAIIVVATKKTPSENVGGSENTSFVLEGSESTEEEEGTVEEEKSDSEETVVGTISTETTPVQTPTSSVVTENIPDTGPEDLLPIALMLGALTAYITTLVMKKRQGVLE